MKKSLFALAALGAIASSAQAQSSVTVYGVIDEGFVSSNVRLANAPGGTINGVPAGGVVNSTNSAIASGAESTGRLGFKGNEDIGGGLSAFFTYEMKLDPNQPTLPSTTQDTDRQAFVGLKKSGLGQFALGTQYTPIFNAAAATDPGMLNNMMGNVIYDKVSGNTSPALQVSASQANANTYVAAPAAYQYSGMQNNTSFTVRATNMISVATETFAGFQGNAMYVMKNQNTNSQTTAAGTTGYANGTTNSTAWGLGANYTWTKLLLTANYQNFTDKSPYTLSAAGVYTAGGTVQNGYGGQNGVGTNDRDNQQYYAATYDFGILKAYVQYVNRKTMDVNNSANYIARTAQQIGVRSYVTPVVEAWASVGTGKLTIANSGGANGTTATNNMASSANIGSNSANFGAFQLGSNYWLSKRTNLYAIYGQERTSNQNFVLNANPTSYNMSSYAVGVRHTF
jgi:predicted porin